VTFDCFTSFVLELLIKQQTIKMKNITVFCLCFFFLNQCSSQDIFSEYENEDSSNTSDNQKLNEKDNIVFEDLTNNNTGKIILFLF
jgi:hypothetical protein